MKASLLGAFTWCSVAAATWKPVRREGVAPEEPVRRTVERLGDFLSEVRVNMDQEEDASDEGKTQVFEWPVTVQNLEAAAGQGVTKIIVQVRNGVGSVPLTSVDEFLTPRFEWRARFDVDRNMPNAGELTMTLAPQQHLPLLKELGQRQFETWRGTDCNASVSVSDNLIGSGLEGDLGYTFMNWIRGDRATAFAPVWRSGLHRPFCGDEDIQHNSHQCFFLPITSCTIGKEQWEAIKGSKPGNAALFNATITRSLIERPYSQVIGDTWPLWNLLFYRMNTRTLQEVAIREHRWRQTNPSWPTRENGKCLAMHVRHGDKITPFWKKLRHAEAGNSGGFARSLDEYIDEALHLLESNGEADRLPQIMVMSDDSDIIDDSTKTSRATMYHVEAGRPLQSLSKLVAADDKGRGFAYDQDNSESMLQHILNIRLMAVCDYFVANLDSGFSKFIFYSTCAEREGSCPSATTLGKFVPAPSSQFHVSVKLPQVVQPAGESTG